MKETFRHWYRALSAMLLTMLGFSSCDKFSSDEPCLYGSPTSVFQVKGCITAEDGTPIEGIKAVVGIDYAKNGKNIYRLDSAYTDSQGNYTIDKQNFGGDINKNSLQILLEDVDGDAKGGTFANDTVKGDELTIEKTGGKDGTWSIGSYAVTANKKLKKKQ